MVAYQTATAGALGTAAVATAADAATATADAELTATASSAPVLTPTPTATAEVPTFASGSLSHYYSARATSYETWLTTGPRVATDSVADRVQGMRVPTGHKPGREPVR